jgi:thymidylate synthase (FAD)
MITIVKPGYRILTPMDTLTCATRRITAAAEVCYLSEPHDDPIKFVTWLVKRGHESTIEHEGLCVEITCSRACSHELVRHRLASYSQVSQRYVDYADKPIAFICPPEIADLPAGDYHLIGDMPNTSTWHHYKGTEEATWEPLYMINAGVRAPEYLFDLQGASTRYLDWRAKGIKPEDARYVLPNATATKVVMTANFREWRHVFKIRGLNPHAQWEIRGIVHDLLLEVATAVPAVFGDLITDEGARA